MKTEPNMRKNVTTSGKFFFWNTIYGKDAEHDTPYMTRIGMGRLRLHFFWRGDQDPDCHDHPWKFWTFPLTSYVEEVAVDNGDGTFTLYREVVSAFWPHYRPATHTHRVIGRWTGHVAENSLPLTDERPVITIVWRGQEEREWGFLKNVNRKWCWTDFKSYVYGESKYTPCE